jgi:hypothetical protein
MDVERGGDVTPPPDDEGDESASRGTQLEVASYIEILSAELSEMAKAADLKSLAYFLEMARLEASIQVERHAMSMSMSMSMSES